MNMPDNLYTDCNNKFNKISNTSWNDLALKHGFKSGEALRSWYRRDRKRTEIHDDYFENEGSVESVDSKEEFKRISIAEFDDSYRISSPTRSYTISKEMLRELKLLYCDSDPMSINGICRKLDIARRDFFLVKNAFNITHDDVPYIDEDLNEDIDFLVEESLERKKEKYFLKLQSTEYEFLKNEIKKYRAKNYLYEKIIAELNNVSFDCCDYSNRKYKASNREGLLNLADVHLGIATENFWNKYNVRIARERFKKLTEEVINVGIETNIAVLHVSNLGDQIAGIIHDSIVKESEIGIVQQVKEIAQLIGTMLIEFSTVFDIVVYSSVSGNHGRIVPEINKSTEDENFELLVNWGLELMLAPFKNIVFNSNIVDENIIVKEISGTLIYQVHGNYDKFDKIASDLTMMLSKPSEIHLAHLHHFEAKETHCVDVFISRSFCGVEQYAKGKRLTSKAGQSLFIYENGKRKFIADILF
jgi:hypothetical protein